MLLFIASEIGNSTLWIAGVSLLVSLSAFGFSVYSALRLDRATLAADIDTRIVYTDTDDAVPTVTVSVVNVGKRPIHLRSLWLYFGRRPWRWYNNHLPAKLNDRLISPMELEPHYESEIVRQAVRSFGAAQPIPGRLEIGSEAVLIYEFDQIISLMTAKPDECPKAFAVARGTTDSAWSKGLSLEGLLQGREKLES